MKKQKKVTAVGNVLAKVSTASMEVELLMRAYARTTAAMLRMEATLKQMSKKATAQRRELNRQLSRTRAA